MLFGKLSRFYLRLFQYVIAGTIKCGYAICVQVTVLLKYKSDCSIMVYQSSHDLNQTEGDHGPFYTALRVFCYFKTFLSWMKQLWDSLS